jgi:hypothetical protein
MDCSAHRAVVAVAVAVAVLPQIHETKFLIVGSHDVCLLILIHLLKGLHRVHVNSVADVSEVDATSIFRIEKYRVTEVPCTYGNTHNTLRSCRHRKRVPKKAGNTTYIHVE